MERALLRSGSCGSWLTGHAGALIAGLAVVWMASAPNAAWGQSSWPSYPNNTAISVTSGGNVGIGTSSPETRLHVEGWATFHFDDWGNDTVIFRGQKNTAYGWGEYAIRTSYLGLQFRNTQTNANMLFLGQTGNVGIGTTSPQYKLAVNGTIGAKEVIVTNTGWPDYVFKPGYRLPPLSQVAAYIHAHHHLPDVPSEAEVKEKGVSVGDMQAKLLAKIEELTLHMIQQDGENRELRKRMAQQEEGNEQLRRRIAQLETRATGIGPAAAGR